MITLSVLGGFASVPRDQEMVVVAEGLPVPGTNDYWVAIDVGGASDRLVSADSAQPDDTGRAIWNARINVDDFPVGGTYDLYLHQGGVGDMTPATRIAGPLSVTWDATDGDEPVYITAPPVLTSVTAETGKIHVEWAAATVNDVRGEIRYVVLRSGANTSSPPVAILGLSYDDTDEDLVAGTTYAYRIAAFYYLNKQGDNLDESIDLSNLLEYDSERVIGTDRNSNTLTAEALTGSGGGDGYTPYDLVLCGWSEAKNNESVYLTLPGGPYWMFLDTPGGLEPCDLAISGRYDPNSDGYTIIGLNASNDTFRYWVHDNGFSGCSEHGTRNGVFRVWQIPITWWAGGPVPTYFTDGPVLSVTPGDSVNELLWTSAPACSPLLDVTYRLERSTTGPSSGFTILASGLTSLSYSDLSANNGTTYWYRVTARAFLSHHSTVAPLGTSVSNVESGTPTSTVTATVTSLCVTTIKVGCTLTLLAEGLPAGHVFTWRINGSSSGGGVADANGRARFNYTNALPGSDAITITDSGGLIATGPTITWVSGGTCPTYLSGAPTLTGFVGASSNRLNWTAAAVCDPRLVVHYEVYRRPAGVGAYTKLVDLLPDLTYTDYDVETCDEFQYKVRAVASLYAPTDTGTFGSLDSNVVELDKSCGVVVFDGIRYRAGDPVESGPLEVGSLSLDEVRWRIGEPGVADAGVGLDLSRVRYRIGDPE